MLVLAPAFRNISAILTRDADPNASSTPTALPTELASGINAKTHALVLAVRMRNARS